MPWVSRGRRGPFVPCCHCRRDRLLLRATEWQNDKDGAFRGQAGCRGDAAGHAPAAYTAADSYTAAAAAAAAAPAAAFAAAGGDGGGDGGAGGDGTEDYGRQRADPDQTGNRAGSTGPASFCAVAGSCCAARASPMAAAAAGVCSALGCGSHR